MAEVVRQYSNFAIPVIEPAAEDAAIGLNAQARGEAPLRLAADDGTAVRPWRITPEQKALAIERFRAGDSIRRIARMTGTAWSTAQALLADEIAKAGPRPSTGHQMTAAEVDEAAELRAQGWSYAALGRRYGVSRTAITKRLQRLRSGRRSR